MDPLTEDRHWHLAAEVAANLAEVSRWEWSRQSADSAALASRLADALYRGDDPAELADVVTRLSEAIGSDPSAWISPFVVDASDDAPVPANLHRWRADAHRAFYALRAALYPDGREAGS